jgi:hypothetical protein
MSSPPPSGDGGSSPNSKKRTRSEEEEEEERSTTPSSPVTHPKNDVHGPPGEPGEPSNNDGRQPSNEPDLLSPLSPFDWASFQQRCSTELSSVSAEESALLEEYRGWEWFHELWTTARSASESVRLSRE